METTFFIGKDITEIKKDDIEYIKTVAQNAPLKRARYCLHRSHEDLIQDMVIAFHKDSYIRPHKHINKTETFHVIEGNLYVVFFDDKGIETSRIEMGPYNSGKILAYRLNSDLWHTVIPLDEYVVIHETVTGPYSPNNCIFPSWA